jgi:phage terminase small subunit
MTCDKLLSNPCNPFSLVIFTCMAKSKLTPKQEAFARAYVETGNASEAYRRSFEVGKNTKPESVWVNASKLLSDAKVAQRVEELFARAVERTMVTVDSLTRELDEDRVLARKLDMPSAAITAVMGKAKLHGLAADRMALGGDPKNTTPIQLASSKDIARAMLLIISRAEQENDPS